MGNIAIAQNESTAIDTLAAFSWYYGRAKLWHVGRIFVTVLLAAIGPVLFLIWPDSKAIVAAAAGAFAIAARFLFEPLEDFDTLTAARIQEQFDTDLFALTWNDLLVGDRVTPELVAEGSRRFRGDRSQLENWYADPTALAPQFAVAACQHTNLVWDFRLRRHYGRSLAAFGTLWFVVSLLVALWFHTTVNDYLLAYFLPALPGYLLATSLARAQLHVATDKERLATQVRMLFAMGKVWSSADLGPRLRQVQDCIFRFRVSAPPVPDLWQRNFKSIFEADAAIAISRFRQQLDESNDNS